jgi:hypothetical protein
MLTRVTGARAAAVLASLGPYREMLEPQRQHLLDFYRPIDVAFKVVGTGSVGLRDYCIIWRATAPAIRCFCRSRKKLHRPTRRICPMRTSRRAQRQAHGRGAAYMQIQTDPFLGWTHIGSRQYLVRQLNDHKGSIAMKTWQAPISRPTPKSAASCWRAATAARATRR